MISAALAAWMKRLWENKTGSDSLCLAGIAFPGCYFDCNLKKKKEHTTGENCVDQHKLRTEYPNYP